MLKLDDKEWYVVKDGQTLSDIARAFCVSERILAKENGLCEPPRAGRVLHIPDARGNAYTVREGDSRALLCGSAENFERKNGENLYLGMRVVL